MQIMRLQAGRQLTASRQIAEKVCRQGPQSRPTGPCLEQAVQAVQLALQADLSIPNLPMVSLSSSPHTGHNFLQLGPAPTCSSHMGHDA